MQKWLPVALVGRHCCCVSYSSSTSAHNNCTNLEVLDLGRNKIADTFPSWLGGLLNLRVLVLRSNQFHGSIGSLEDEKSGDQFASLQIIDLASNNFSVELHPHWFENLKSMKKYNNRGQIIGHGILTSGFYLDSVTISYKGFMVTFERILTTLTAIEYQIMLWKIEFLCQLEIFVLYMY